MNGYNNEYNFVLEFNNKKIKELNPILQDLIYSIFSNIKENDLIKSWRNHYDQKTDIFLKIGNAIKGISIKFGSRNSVHVESIWEFEKFLLKHNIPRSIICKYLDFHYADGTINNSGIKRLTTEEYKKINQNKIDKINEYFNTPEIIFDAIERFVLKGNNSEYPINAIILGDPNNFIWLTKNDIIEILNSNINKHCSSPHFSELVCQPMNRCINHNIKYEKYRRYVQIKWYSLFDNIIEQMNNNAMKKSGYILGSNLQADSWDNKKRAIHNE